MRAARILALVAAACLLIGPVVASGQAASAIRDSDQRERDFAAVAQEFGVPEAVLKAVSYALTRWDDRDGEPTRYGGYGPMHLTDAVGLRLDDRGQIDPAEDPRAGRLRAAAALLGVASTEVRSDAGQNIRAGAALLAQYARQAGGGRLPLSTAGWSAAVARFGAGNNPATGAAFVEDVFALLRTGLPTTTVDGQRIALPADPGLPPLSVILGKNPECPPEGDCRFVSAAYAQTDPADPNAYGNYDPADRPDDGNDIRYILIHSTESTYSSTINAFGDPNHGASTHYVIRSADGEITQMVRTDDVAFHAGNWTFNSRAIGIEHEGFVADGATWFTQEMYRSSARLVRYLAERYDIPLDRRHILGSDEIQRGTPDRVAGAHYDPATYWNWPYFMALLGAGDEQSVTEANSEIVTITPPFAGNEQPVRSCDPGNPGEALPAQGTNFLYLRSAPSEEAPLIGDPVLHPDGGPGTTQICDWSSKALFGRSFVLAGSQGEWKAIWHGGTKGWFRDPAGALSQPGAGRLVKPAPGLDSIPVYGVAYPEPEAFPSTIPVQEIQPLQYRIAAGQRYTVTDVLPGQYYYSRFDGADVPDNHTLVVGERRYALINFNYRHAYVDLDHVRFVNSTG
ncbi:MAG: N-acetylmuramoyl-L-alanine amidase [Pseudonocardiaceae bacterium]